MDRKKILLYVEAGLWILWVVLMCIAAINIYRQGAAYQAAGHPEEWIYTREKVSQAFVRCLPVLIAAVITAIACAVMGIGPDKNSGMYRGPELAGLYKAEREQERDIEKELSTAKKLRIARMVLFAAAAVFILAGILNGSMEDTLIKAVNICTECVGLG